MTTTIHRGDFVQWMRGHEWLAQNGYIPKAHAHAVLCDPPYFLGSIVKRFGGANAAPAKYGTDGVYQRASRGFMGQKWDGFSDVWEYQQWVTEWGRLMLSYVYPGGVLAAFGGTRTYHRLAAGLEDAGWIVFDCMMWTYSSGFPKSHNIGKAIDKHGGQNIGWFGPWLREERIKRGLTQKTLAQHFPSVTGNLTGCVANWELGYNLPTVEQFNTLCKVLDLPFKKLEEAEREILATKTDNGKRHVAILGTDAHEFDITAPATDAARQWDGYGTALSPSYEPIVLCRAPWSGTYAGIAQQYGTGAINVDGGRIGTEDKREYPNGPGGKSMHYSDQVSRGKDVRSAAWSMSENGGRWPKNLILSCACPTDDHAPDCPVRVMGEQSEGTRAEKPSASGGANLPMQSMYAPTTRYITHQFSDEGSAARFYYTAKAAAWERSAGLHTRAAVTVNDGRQTPIDNPYQRGETKRLNVHPTVKPIQLTEYIARLLLPPTLSEPRRLLVPFSGSGSEMIGAMLAGWEDIVGFEQSDDYADIAEARIAWWSQFSDYDTAKRAYDADHAEQQQREAEAAHGNRQLTLFEALPETVSA